MFREYLTSYVSSYDGLKVEFATEMSTHPSTLSNYLSGKRQPTHKFLQKMAEKEQKPYEEFITKFKPTETKT